MGCSYAMPEESDKSAIAPKARDCGLRAKGNFHKHDAFTNIFREWMGRRVARATRAVSRAACLNLDKVVPPSRAGPHQCLHPGDGLYAILKLDLPGKWGRDESCPMLRQDRRRVDSRR